MKVHELITLLQTYNQDARVVICSSAYEGDQEMTHELREEDILLTVKVGCKYEGKSNTYFVEPAEYNSDVVIPEEHVISLAGY